MWITSSPRLRAAKSRCCSRLRCSSWRATETTSFNDDCASVCSSCFFARKCSSARAWRICWSIRDSQSSSSSRGLSPEWMSMSLSRAIRSVMREPISSRMDLRLFATGDGGPPGAFAIAAPSCSAGNAVEWPSLKLFHRRSTGVCDANVLADEASPADDWAAAGGCFLRAAAGGAEEASLSSASRPSELEATRCKGASPRPSPRLASSPGLDAAGGSTASTSCSRRLFTCAASASTCASWRWLRRSSSSSPSCSSSCVSTRCSSARRPSASASTSAWASAIAAFHCASIAASTCISNCDCASAKSRAAGGPAD
mmetsp:Transcript_40098/g.97348  ORF Transcript_40098/g.97348 Transcript_40098/m.97348 type:complete len:313 (+) Transcript_40098:688-1626(+)